jgi:chemotaxis protein methyltransferase CheR
MGLRWSSHRRVRGQIEKRLQRHARSLSIENAAGCRERLDRDPRQWQKLRSLCRVTISRFYRDGELFDRIGQRELPRLAGLARRRGAAELRCLSAGCGAGEEVYSLALLWYVAQDGPALAARYPDLELRCVGIDIDEGQLARARRAVYPAAALRELPAALRASLRREADHYEVPEAFRCGVELRHADLREHVPDGPFDLVLCRNLAFSYFDAELRQRALERFADVMRQEATLVLGRGETLPDPASDPARGRPAPRELRVLAPRR